MQPDMCSPWLISIDHHRVLESASGAMFLNEKPPMSMIQGKCACFRAKMVQIPGHLPLSRQGEVLTAANSLSSFDESRAQPGTALAGSTTEAFACAFIVARADASPGSQVPCIGETRHICSNFRCCSLYVGNGLPKKSRHRFNVSGVSLSLHFLKATGVCRLRQPGEKVLQIGTIGARCMPAGIFGVKRLLERFKKCGNIVSRIHHERTPFQAECVYLLRQGSVVKKSPSQLQPSHRVTLSEAKGLSRSAERSFASLRMTGLTLSVGEELSRSFEPCLNKLIRMRGHRGEAA